MALALKHEYEALETHELQEKWLSNKIAAFSAVKDVGLFVLYNDILLSNVHAAWR